MVLKVDITREDITDFNLFHRRQSTDLRRQTLLYTCMFSCSLLVFFACFSLLGPSEYGFWYWLSLSVGLALVCALFVYKVLQWDYVMTINRYYDDCGHASIGESTLTFLEDRIIDKGKWCTVMIPYSKIERIVQSDLCLYLYINSGMAIIIPLRDFADDHERNALLILLRQKCIKSCYLQEEYEQQDNENQR